MGRQLEGDLEHVLAEQRHPSRAIGLFEMTAGRQRRAAIEHADIVQSKEAALKQASARSGPCDSPTSRNSASACRRPASGSRDRSCPQRLLRPIEEDRSPGVDRRVHIAEVPLVGRDLPGRMQVDLVQQQIELLLGEIRSTVDSAIVWKARSQAANQGYSHLSGIEMTWSAIMWNHSRLRRRRTARRHVRRATCRRRRRKYCLLHSMPASACRITLACILAEPGGVIA